MQRGFAIGVDVGGTKVLACLVDGRGRALRTVRGDSGASAGRARLHANVIAAIDAVRDRRVRHIGVGIAGQVDPRTGVFLSGPHFHRSAWGLPLRALLAKRYGLPVAALNDAQAMTLAEAVLGAGKGRRVGGGITIGTGVGGGITVDGHLLRGSHGTAGEFGHMTVHATNAVRCACGGRNHLEAFVSGSAARHAYAALTGKSRAATDVLAIEREARRGKRPAAHLWRHMAEALSIGFADILAALDPDLIVVGGGLARTSLWRQAARLARARLPFPSLAKTPILAARFGEAASAVGAALFAQEGGKR